ncbi:NAD(P)-binding protein [Coniophora puteana RWD-64-598 SS2]|uniref:NAD(P)-binding protein n=1 Tax=Coniophora puteana (strain RWD-64-598) TaxID=741705 RepID=A0A5M3MVH0_CONPW|nr:NAD(P)-binding protein [Coniophora puteana RWD-64-598 SS2]EIW82705.1 NAD(P)-binding protein [Coniophora puteana RWD-64-598 SS2]
MAPKVWFITGASAGFGRSVTECILKKGDIAVATLRTPSALADLSERYPSSQLLVLRLDVTRPDEISVAFAAACEAFGRVDVVFNNAGICTIAEAEGMSDGGARELFEVLFWGAANVTREAVRVFRDVNVPTRGGRLLQMSSRTALEVVPGAAHYGAALVDVALEALTEGYKAELDPAWGIKITLVEPALFRTNAPWSNTLEPVHPAYSDPSLPSRKYRCLYPGAERFSDGDSDKLAEVMHRLANEEDPPFRLPLHRVAVAAAKRKGLGLVEAAEKYGGWSDDVYLDELDTVST